MPTPKKKKAEPRKKIENRCDKHWLYLVKERAGNKCEKCGAGWKYKEYISKDGSTKSKRYGLEAHHIIGRSYKATRWNLGNGLCLCTSCHKYRGAHSECFIDQVDFHEWLFEHWTYERLDYGQLSDVMRSAEAWGAKPLPMAQLHEIDAALKLAVK